MTQIRGLVVILGGGESGVGAALLAKEKYTDVWVSDFGTIKPEYINELEKAHIPFEEKGHSIDILEKALIVVKSPGIPETSPIVISLRAKGLKIVSEIEFGAAFYNGLTIGITGSNGKTTTSGLLCHLLKQGGRDVALGGNYGKSFCRILSESHPDIMVLEISSFQLDDIDGFNPDIALLLNLSPDHLDRYNYEYQNYIDAKFKIIQNQNESDVFIFNGDDQRILDEVECRETKQTCIAIKSDDYINGISSKDGSYNFSLTLKGGHNLFNAACAVCASRLVGLTEEEIALGLSTFENAAHRLEQVAVIDEVTYINDSKATNVDATFYGLSSVDEGLVWIAGGVDKGNDYTALFPVIGNVKALICLGRNNEELKNAFDNKIEIIRETEDVDECISIAASLAQKGDTVLLSPACASFDLFDNYQHRGVCFREAVLKLK